MMTLDAQARHRTLALLGVAVRSVPALPDAAEEPDVQVGDEDEDAQEPDGEPDEDDADDALPDDDTEALLLALAELEETPNPDGERAVAFNPALHPHGGRGRFITTIDRLKAAIVAHQAAGGNGNPFTGFTRDQLMRAAGQRGIKLQRGASHDDYTKALIASLTNPTASAPHVPAAPVAAKVASSVRPQLSSRPPLSSKPGSVSYGVTVGGVAVGDIHRSGGPGGMWTAFPPFNAAWGITDGPGSGGSYNTQVGATRGLVAAYRAAHPTSQPSPASALPPGVTLTSTGNLLLNGAVIGGVHPSPIAAGYYVGYDAHGVQLPASFPDRQSAIQAVFTHHSFGSVLGGSTTPPAPNVPSASATPRSVPPAGAVKLSKAVTGGRQGIYALSVPPSRGTYSTAKRSLEIYDGGTLVGTAHHWPGNYWTAEDGSGNHVALGGVTTKTRTVQALLAHHQANPPAPPASPTPTVARPPDRQLQAVLDVVYGKDPKAKTATRQLAVYGAMRRNQFDQLDAVHQQVVMGDLGYIAQTSKGPAAKQAQTIIDRLAPPGTKPGTIPTPSTQIVGPATGKQHRFPTPAPGLLKQAAKSGIRGDDWMYPTGGSGGKVWGKYGSGGLLLRHTDAQGVERFLMTQRGPGISDPGKWSYPGGAFESLENEYQGATREVAEELGFTDADFAPATVHGFHVFERPDVVATDGKTGKPKPWTYHSIAADVPTMLKPNLSTHGAQAETSDAKWLTLAEIQDLDRKGMLHQPVAGGKLQANVMSLFPAQAATPAPATVAGKPSRPARLTGPVPTAPPSPLPTHKKSRATDMIADKTAIDQLHQDVKKARAKYAGKVADDRLAAIAAMQGFDDTPTVVSKDDFDKLLATGDYIEVWRGVQGSSGYSSYRATHGGQVSSRKTAAQINEELRSGPAYFGKGVYGNGYYFAGDKSIAQGYSDRTSGSLLRALIPRRANTIAADKAEREAHAISTARSKAKGGSNEEGTLYDEGRYAAAKGYDAVEITPKHGSHVARSGKHAYNVVNRSILIVQEA